MNDISEGLISGFLEGHLFCERSLLVVQTNFDLQWSWTTGMHVDKISFMMHIVHGKVALIAISLHLLYMSTVLPGSWWCWRHWLGTLIILGVETLVIVAVYKAGMFDLSWIYVPVQWWQRIPHTCTTYLWSTSSTLRLFGSSVSRMLIRLVSSLGNNFSVLSRVDCGSSVSGSMYQLAYDLLSSGSVFWELGLGFMWEMLPMLCFPDVLFLSIWYSIIVIWVATQDGVVSCWKVHFVNSDLDEVYVGM